MLRFRVTAPLLGVIALACSSEGVSPGAAGAGGSGGTTGDAGVAGANRGGGGGTAGSGRGGAGVDGTTCSAQAGEGGNGDGPASCDMPSYADATVASVMVGKVTITVHDTDGMPVVGTPVTVCGVDVCSHLEHADTEGVAVVNLMSAVKKPALKFGDGLVHAELAILLEDAEAGVVFPDLTLPALPAQGAPISACNTARSNGAELTLAPNATFTLDILPPYDTADTRAFRAAELPPEQFPDGIDHGAGLERIFTLAPLGAVICPPAELRLPNVAGWEPGTRVEFLVQGFGTGLEDGAQPFAPYGEWQSVATGVVDAHGETLRTTSGGLPIISNVGVRRL
ncbi:MAG TPA: hypothetical protein VLJ38_15065 [Polyangiaceae bacterium]|nr:hypothetical protein [Polyangiaceae bacterium]